MRLARTLVMIGSPILLSGCGSIGGNYLVSHKINWSKPGLDQQQLNADWYQCRKENTPEAEYYWIVDENMAKQCMAAKGYTYTEEGF
jgi:hypothetical protein